MTEEARRWAKRRFEKCDGWENYWKEIAIDDDSSSYLRPRILSLGHHTYLRLFDAFVTDYNFREWIYSVVEHFDFK